MSIHQDAKTLVHVAFISSGLHVDQGPTFPACRDWDQITEVCCLTLYHLLCSCLSVNYRQKTTEWWC